MTGSGDPTVPAMVAAIPWAGHLDVGRVDVGARGTSKTAPDAPVAELAAAGDVISADTITRRQGDRRVWRCGRRSSFSPGPA